MDVDILKHFLNFNTYSNPKQVRHEPSAETTSCDNKIIFALIFYVRPLYFSVYLRSDEITLGVLIMA